MPATILGRGTGSGDVAWRGLTQSEVSGIFEDSKCMLSSEASRFRRFVFRVYCALLVTNIPRCPGLEQILSSEATLSMSFLAESPRFPGLLSFTIRRPPLDVSPLPAVRLQNVRSSGLLPRPTVGAGVHRLYRTAFLLEAERGSPTHTQKHVLAHT